MQITEISYCKISLIEGLRALNEQEFRSGAAGRYSVSAGSTEKKEALRPQQDKIFTESASVSALPSHRMGDE